LKIKSFFYAILYKVSRYKVLLFPQVYIYLIVIHKKAEKYKIKLVFFAKKWKIFSKFMVELNRMFFGKEYK